jgi:iron complex transport system substrate-binding protein
VKGNGITMARTRPRPSRLLLLLVALALLLSACGQQAAATFSSVGAAAPPPSASSSSAPSAAVAWPLTLTDDTGATLTLDAAPSRVVSLAPSNTEIVCAVGACSELVGVTDFDDFPASVANVAKVVVNATVDPEKVVAARPDLVLAAGNGLTPDAVITQLRGLGLKVLTLYPADLAGIYADIALVGRALGRAGPASSLVAGMQARVDAVRQAVAASPRPRVFYEVSVYQGVIYTAGAGSFLASLIEMAGGDPVTGGAQTTAIGLEDLVNADPEVILLGDASYDPSLQGRDSALAQVRARPGWEVMTAVRDGRVIPYTQDIVTTRPGPRIVDGLEALARAIHPEAFNR